MIKFRTRLVLALISLIVMVLIALGILLGQLFKGYYLNALNDRLDKETTVLAKQISLTGGIEKLNDQLLLDWSKELNVRMSIADSAGNIVMDSGATENSNVYNHETIVKRIAALDKPSNYQSSLAAKLDVQYHWKKIITSQKGEEGFLIISTRVKVLDHIYSQIWMILLLSLGASLILIILFGTKITNRYTRPIESATKVAIELAKGNYKARTYEIPPDEVGVLNTSINILARNLQEMMQAQEVHHNRLTTIIENIESGLLLIDDRGFIVMVNQSLKNLFHVKNERLIKKRYHEVLRHKEVIEIIEEVFMTENNVRKQLVLPLSIERKHFEISGAPIIGTNDEWKGILIVFHDITEIKHLEQMRKDFVANVSHELKTPITSIKGFTETLLDGAKADPEALEMFLTIISKESERMETLVMDLLELSKIEQKGMVLSLNQVNIEELIEDILPTLEKRLENKRMNVTVDLKGDLTITGDLYRLKQVFLNLITNAILYTQQEGSIRITGYEEKGYAVIEVSDNGIGIAEEEVPRIFERFYRVDKARSRNSGGTGLGLAIVKHIIEAHRGKIYVRSQLNEGTTFVVKLRKELEKSS
ncbi:two-component system phosphate regulon sensor histidine kinase PhoR [Bacillus ectoiniformans]|uniref:two-component system histidine kinase PnpS n=1 Tax=Bacillus ectoiniformans TaxID=1494429 RepID=UPI0019592C0D|nr:ATP-binding protein [Bacillus ectoiniformans]MBM7648850.1 two-component system phosphate regulon sensor histidine kinase PhoR [Bacillus ectoiniformans]